MVLDLDRQRWTLVDAIVAAADRYGGRTFLDFVGGEEVTFAAFDERTSALVASLGSLGAEPGDRILMLGHNSLEFLLALGATSKLGATFVPINTELKGAFLEHQVRNAEPTVVFCDSELVQSLASLTELFDGVRAVVVTDGPADAGGCRAFPSAAWLTFDEFVADARPTAVTQPAPGDPAMIMYTSGTTGPSKGVIMPHGHCYMFGLGLARAVGATEDDHYYVCMPLFHANGLLMQVVGCLLAGTTATVARRFSASNWLEEVRACGATLTNALGVMPEFIVRQPPTAHDSDNLLRAVMAVPISEEWGADFERRFGVSLLQGFGMTECNMVAYSRKGDDLIPGCAGHIADDWFDVRIVDPESDQVLASGEVGEIAIRPLEPSCFMAGYDKMPDKTVEAWRNLWFHTGDAGFIDADGRLHFVDRINDRIRRRGENISSFEVEQVINNHPHVAESAVVGVKADDGGGEDEIKAVVVLEPDVALDPVDLLDHCVANMPRHAVPRYVEFVESLDKTPTGKLRKKALRESGHEGSWDRTTVGYEVPR